MTESLKQIAAQTRECVQIATKGLIGRESLAELIILATVAKEHLLIIGPPGTAKSAVVRRVANLMKGRYFEYLLGRFTEPSELFGTVNLKKLREGTVETDIEGMLPDADIVFLDEVFLGSTAILNTLLSILNERYFRRGHTQIECPLKVCIGAANNLPDDEALAAFSDRFLLRLFIEPIEDQFLEEMLAGGWQAEQHPTDGPLTVSDLVKLSEQVKNVNLDEIIAPFSVAIRHLRRAGISLSDRRIVKTQRLIAAAALLSGRINATQADLWPLFYVLPTPEAQQRGREILADKLAFSQNSNLFNAVEEATLQPFSRVARLVETANRCLTASPAEQPALVKEILREIDANFTEKTLPEALAELRQRLIDVSASNE